MGWFFAFFLLSGFCGLVYQVVWLRTAMAAFGVTTSLVSIVLSVFMAGLALGSWGGGRLARRFERIGTRGFLRLYSGTELLIGVSGLAVAPLLGWGRVLLSAAGEQAAWGSGSYYLASAACVTGALLPFCVCMGATFPIAMAGVRAAFPDTSSRSFSFLYIANVLGAMAGALSSAFVLIELLGFRGTLLVAAGVNAAVAAMALVVSWRLPATHGPGRLERTQGVDETARRTSRLGLAFLFTTGLVSLALEVVWTRQFVPFQGPVVYTFATMLAVYLAATAIGSRVYRTHSAGQVKVDAGFPWVTAASLAGASGLIALLAADPRLPLSSGLRFGTARIVLGVGPFCAVLGFFTPMLVDRLSGGDPRRAGTAYAVNTVGCILGPLISGFVLLPLVGERWTTVLLLLPLFAFAAAGRRRSGPSHAELTVPGRISTWIFLVSAATALALIAFTRDFESKYPERIVFRDHTATVTATGEGRNRQLLVNGYGMTSLTPITKMMAHLPLAMLERKPEKGLVLCLGMGTSFRSMLSWGIPSTVVELIPSVPRLLPFYQPDGGEILRSPLARIVVDDARRFLDRSSETYDVIVVDPPPPVEAAGSSLLYTVEFYGSVRRRLAPGGILQQWLPRTETLVVSAVARAIAERFPHVRVFRSVEGWGFHFLASDRPIANRSAADMALRLPDKASRDIVEWGPYPRPDLQFSAVLRTELPLRSVIAMDPSAPVMTDQRPVNEYYFVRRLLKRITL